MKEHFMYLRSEQKSSLRQGEILTGVVQYNPIIDKTSQEELQFTPVVHPYAIVITQDCDLDWDYKSREMDNNPSKLLNSVILCEIDKAASIRQTDGMYRKEWDLIEAHRHERYYFLQKVSHECELEREGLPELTADFKRVFGIDTVALYSQIKLGIVKRRTILASPYLEHFSRRYHSFHSRVALPLQYESEREG
jgi:hypothetical protein